MTSFHVPAAERNATERVSTIGIDNDSLRGQIIGLMRIYDEHSQQVYGTSTAPVRTIEGDAASFSVSFRNGDGLDRREVYLVRPGTNMRTDWDEIRRIEDEYREWIAECERRDEDPEEYGEASYPNPDTCQHENVEDDGDGESGPSLHCLDCGKRS